MTDQKLQPLAPVDVELRTDKSGEKYAWDSRNSRIISTGFDDDDDFEEWKEKFFKLPSNFTKE